MTSQEQCSLRRYTVYGGWITIGILIFELGFFVGLGQ